MSMILMMDQEEEETMGGREVKRRAEQERLTEKCLLVISQH
jgi:hypothetical protein